MTDFEPRCQTTPTGGEVASLLRADVERLARLLDDERDRSRRYRALLERICSTWDCGEDDPGADFTWFRDHVKDAKKELGIT
jgi:predicted GNAT superfamily acetyltransferase